MNYKQLRQREPIPQAEQFTYNKDFNPDDPANVQAWYNLPVPSNMSPGEWQFAVGELLLMCGSKEVVGYKAQQMLFLGWLIKNGLRTMA
jgi:hypothetical protein